MYISQLTERLNFLKRELDDLRQMNLQYWGHSEHSSLWPHQLTNHGGFD
jgi:hypothetical protein